MDSDAVGESRLAESQGNSMDTVVQTAHQLQVPQDLRPQSTTSHELAAAVPLPDIGSSTAEIVLPTKNSHLNSSASPKRPRSSDRSTSFQYTGGETNNDCTPEPLGADPNVPRTSRTPAEQPENKYDPVSGLDSPASDEQSIVTGGTKDDNGDTYKSRPDKASVASEDSAHSARTEANDSKLSKTSTIEHGNEPFDSFQFKVAHLACSTIWPDAKEEEIEVERMRGGSYNRITGITRKSSNGNRWQMQFIVRTPRFEWADGPHAGRDAAGLAFVRAYTRIPVPEVQHWENGDSNVLEGEFVVQSRLRGEPVNRTWGSLNHQQKCKVARELGDMYRQMLSIRSSKAGRFVFIPDIDPDPDVHISQLHEDISSWHEKVEFPRPDGYPPTPFGSSVGCESVGELYLRLIEEDLERETAREIKVRKRDPKRSYFCAVCRCDRRMAEELEEDGWFRNVHYCLVHRDLEARNIIVTDIDDSYSKIISGIIDWDSAVLAPAFLACRPPTWLWLWDGSDQSEYPENHDESQVYVSPRTPEALELKLIFELAAGPIYVKFAYHVAYRLARRLFRFNMGGDTGYDEIDEHEEMFKEWRKFHPGAYEFDPDDIDSFLPPPEGLVVSDDEEPAKCQSCQ